MEITKITLAGNFRPEWNQLVDALSGDEVHDSVVADAASEFVEAVGVLHLADLIEAALILPNLAPTITSRILL